MRARTVGKKCYVFDFDDTLVKTDAKVHVVRDGKRVKSLTPEEYNYYKPKPGDTFDMSDFSDVRYIMSAKKYKLWPALENISNARKMGRSDSDIYILTARAERAQIPIHNFLERNGIDIPLDHVFALGTDESETKDDIASKKRTVLKALTSVCSEVYFFDDSEDNIELAKSVPGVKTRLVDWNK